MSREASSTGTAANEDKLPTVINSDPGLTRPLLLLYQGICIKKFTFEKKSLN